MRGIMRFIQAMSLATVIVVGAGWSPAVTASASCDLGCGCGGSTPPPFALEMCEFHCGSIGVQCVLSFWCAFWTPGDPWKLECVN